MSSTLKRVAAAAAVSVLGVLAPVASASAAATPVTPAARAVFPHLPGVTPGAGLPAVTTGAGLPAFTPGPLAFTAPAVGQVAAVIGPTIITTAPGVTFINTTNQTSAGGALSGGQVAG
jgi:hypothetical protein